MRFENLSFIGPDSVAAGRAAAAAAAQNKLWNFIDVMYLNQGEENTGYVIPTYLRHLFTGVPGLNSGAALAASRTSSAQAALNQASQVAAQYGIDSTPSFLISRAGGPVRRFEPSSLTAAPFAAAIDRLLQVSG